jgi:hypothetical protein
LTGVTHQIVLGHESNFLKTAVLTVIAIVTHEKVLPRWHDSVEVGSLTIPGEHDDMLRVRKCPFQRSFDLVDDTGLHDKGDMLQQ